MRIIVLGGDGYLGWPTCMDLASQGHAVLTVDNYLRRQTCLLADSQPLFEIPTLEKRAAIFKELTGLDVQVCIGDLRDYGFTVDIIQRFGPDAIIHYAEQPSAPFSMQGEPQARLTLMNNVEVTFNVIWAVKETVPDCHIIKLGTMGEYGTPNIDIEEGYIDIEHNGRKDRFLYPRQASSLYHTTKIMDTDMLWFYTRMHGLRVTDLMQGPVYGLSTDQTMIDDRLMPIFNYDDIFGTVVNRFLVQAVAGVPLTVYGKGGQTRGYLNLKDTLQCVSLAAATPPGKGELRILNQFTETFTVNRLAGLIKESAKNFGIEVAINHIENPRIEADEHYYNPSHSGLMELGLKPHYLSAEILGEMLQVIINKKDRIDPDIIAPRVNW